MRISLILLCCLSSACGGGSTSGGAKSVNGTPPAELSYLDGSDQEYVFEQIRHYIRAEPTGVNVKEKTLQMGGLWDGMKPLYRSAVLVHEACHVENNHSGCNPAGERLCNERAAQAMDRLGEVHEAQVWRDFDGMHC